jgi:hypothetical protein
MLTRHSHIYCQVAQVDTQSKTWQRVCLSNRTTDRKTDEGKEALGGNRRLAQWRVTWLIDHSTSYQHFCGVLTVLCSEIRYYAKRQNVSSNI